MTCMLQLKSLPSLPSFAIMPSLIDHPSRSSSIRTLHVVSRVFDGTNDQRFIHTLPAHWTQSLGSILLDPREETVLPSGIRNVIEFCLNYLYHMKGMSTLSIYCNLFSVHECRVDLLWVSHKAQSSPGYLHVGQVPSNWTRQIPQTSSSGMSHRHDATAFHSLIVTFIWVGEAFRRAEKGNRFYQ